MKMLDVPQSGSQAGTTSSRNRYGQYKRTRAMPAQPRTDRQVAVRAALADLSQAWRGLTEDQRSAWKAWADANPRTDSLGQTVFMTGHQAFISVNTTLKQAEDTTTATPPGEVEVSIPQIVLLSPSSDTLWMLIRPTDPLCRVIMFCSPPVSPGVSFASDFRLVDRDTTDDTDWILFDLDEAIIAKFGGLEATKKYIVQWYSENSGLRSADSRKSIIPGTTPALTIASATPLTITWDGTGIEGATVQAMKRVPDTDRYTPDETAVGSDESITVGSAGDYRLFIFVDDVVTIVSNEVAVAGA